MPVVANYPLLDTALQTFSERLDRVRQDLCYCSVTMSASTRTLRENIHASTYVYTAAALEAFLKEALTAILVEINALTIPRSGLRLSLLAIASGATYETLQSVRGLKMWHARAGLLLATEELTPCVLDQAHAPIDGRTVRPDKLEVVWAVLGLPMNPLPSPRHALALQDLANSRNEVAHGELDAQAVAGKKSVDATLKQVDQIEEIAVNLWTAAYEYLEKQLFRR